MAAVVSDTSVLHYLSVTGQFDCLPKLFGQVFIPPAVWNEVCHQIQLPVFSLAKSAIAAGWLKVEAPHDEQSVSSLGFALGAGESQAIVLAKELQPGLLLIDDLDGRLMAQKLKLSVMGTVGILASARRQGLISKLQPILDELIGKHRFRFDTILYAEILRSVGELE